MLTPKQTEQLRAALSTSTTTVALTLHRDGSQTSQQLDALATTLAHGGGKRITVDQREADARLTIETPGRGSISYLAIPEGHQLDPFVETVEAIASATPPKPWATPLTQLQNPARLLLFVGADCPHCPNAARVAIEATLASPHVTLTIVDIQQRPAFAEEHEVRSVPLTLLDEQLVLSGVVTGEQLVGHILARGKPEHLVVVLSSLVENGRIDGAVALMRDHPGALVKTWRQSTTSSRMGLMLAAERLLETHAAALDSVAAPLTEILPTEDVTLRGDTADLLGQIGHPSAKDALERLRDDANPDVAEIAADAIEAIANRQT